MANPNPVPPPEHSRWQPGKSPNPGGKPVGARNRLTGAFLHDLADVYATSGKKAIEKLCEEDPRSFVRAIVSLCPKQIEAAGPLDGLDDGTLQGFLQLFQLYMETRRARVAPEPALNGSGGSSSNDESDPAAAIQVAE